MDSPSLANGQLQVASTWGDFNNIAFVIRQALAKMQTATLVRVVACTNDGGLAPFGFVDVEPLVNQIDGNGDATPHGTVYGLPYARIQGGANAIIIDPAPGDIGLCVFASRDISKVKNTQAAANPGSFRMFSFSDGMYLGGMLNGTPSQYIRFGTDGITIVSPVAITQEAPVIKQVAATSATISSPAIEIDGQMAQGNGPNGGNATFNGPVTVTNDLTANGTSLHTHHHSGVTTGSGNTGGPV